MSPVVQVNQRRGAIVFFQLIVFAAAIATVAFSALQQRSQCGNAGWQEVLKISTGSGPQAREELVQRASKSSGTIERDLAAKILELWPAGSESFESGTPRLIRQPRLQVSRHLAGQQTKGTVVVAEVRVGSEGCVASVRIVRGSLTDEVKNSVTEQISQLMFAPAKKGSRFVEGLTTLSSTIEVR
jgi:hypothetical protein